MSNDTIQMINSEIVDNGEGNILICEDGVKLQDSHIEFLENNALVYLSKNRFRYEMTLKIKGDCVFFSGGDSYFNNVMHIVLSESKRFFWSGLYVFLVD